MAETKNIQNESAKKSIENVKKINKLIADGILSQLSSSVSEFEKGVKGLKKELEAKLKAFEEIRIENEKKAQEVAVKEEVKAEPSKEVVFEKIAKVAPKIDILINCAGFGVSGLIELVPNEVSKKILVNEKTWSMMKKQTSISVTIRKDYCQYIIQRKEARVDMNLNRRYMNANLVKGACIKTNVPVRRETRN